MFALVSSGGIAIFTLLYRRRSLSGGYRGIEFLGMLLLVAGTWILTDSQILRLVTGKVALVSMISFLSFMVMPVFFLFFVNELMVYKSRLLKGLCWLYFANMAVCILLYLFRVISLSRVLMVEHILIIISVVCLLRSAVIEVKRYENREMKIVLVGMSLLSVCALSALALFWRNSAFSYSYLYCIGILIFVVCMIDAAFERFSYYAEQTASADVYEKIAYEDSMTGIANRTAFEKEQAEENEEELHYIVLDINGLKRINDCHGHLAGDRLIIDTARCMKEAFTNGEKCFRIGGDEFVIIVKNCSREEILKRLSRFEQIVAQKSKKREEPIEIAYGYASGVGSRRELFDEADAEMYRKKHEMKQG